LKTGYKLSASLTRGSNSKLSASFIFKLATSLLQAFKKLAILVWVEFCNHPHDNERQ
jgi:hypothetical protein